MTEEMTEDQAVEAIFNIIYPDGNKIIEGSDDVTPDTTPYYCNACKKYFESQDLMAKDKSTKKGFRPLCLKCKATKERQRERMRKNDTITINFSTIPDGIPLLWRILKDAGDNMRTPAMQVLYTLTHSIGKENA